MPHSPILWVIPDPKNLVQRSWEGEDECLVFVEGPGDLHLLTSAAARVLGHLTERALTTDELARVEGCAPDVMEAIVRRLQALGLIDTAVS